jgi:hypothetical protein
MYVQTKWGNLKQHIQSEQPHYVLDLKSSHRIVSTEAKAQLYKMNMKINANDI